VVDLKIVAICFELRVTSYGFTMIFAPCSKQTYNAIDCKSTIFINFTKFYLYQKAGKPPYS
jgi:hypothetical protein